MHIVVMFLCAPSLRSESEPGVEGAGAAAAPIGPDLGPAALLGADPDPHLPGLPDPGLPLGPQAELVGGVDATVRVS